MFGVGMSVLSEVFAMFSDSFRQRLALGKYTKWAENLTEPHLEALLWMVGEYGCRALLVLNLLEKHKDEFWFQTEGFARAKLALETISRIVGGERLDVDEATRRVREVLGQVRSSRNSST
jgi:hypothetical protein